MIQWKCPCGQWVDMTYSRHIHQVTAREPTLAEMHAARMAGRDEFATAAVADIETKYWSSIYPRREKPTNA